MKSFKAIFFLIASAAAGVAACLPVFFQREKTIASVGQGMAGQAGLAGAAISDRLAAWGYHFGGWNLAEATLASANFLPTFLILVIFFAIASKLPARLSLIGSLLLLATISWITTEGILATVQAQQEEFSKETRLLAPIDLINAVKKPGGSVFYNPDATAPIALFAPTLLDPSVSQSSRQSLCQSAQAWRAQDLATPYAFVLFVGNLSASRPLIDFLLTSPNWHLKMADNHGLLFARGAGPGFRPGQPDSVKCGSTRNNALFCARAALTFESIGMKTEARDYIISALNHEPMLYPVLLAASSIYASQGQWTRARSMADRALKKNPSSFQAAYLRALALLESGVVEKAYHESAQLLTCQPNDIPSLLLNARTCHAVHDFDSEIRSLEKLLSLAQKSKAPDVRIRIYLAQAWAQKGFPDQAIENYRTALNGRILPSERREIEEAVRLIENNRLPNSPRIP